MEKRLDFVDALRGLAIFGVILVHTFNPIIERLPKPLGYFVANGARGVQLFFFVSAFTLFLSFENRQSEKKPIRNFFLRRFFRIAPLFYLAMAVYLALNGTEPRYWLGEAQVVSGWNIAATALFINGWYPYWFSSVIDINWTIAVEMSFYMLVPFLFRKITSLFDALFLTFSWTTLLFFLNPFLARHNPIGSSELWTNFINLWLPNQFPVFCMGIILYFLLKENHLKKKVFSKIYVFGAITLVFISLSTLFILKKHAGINYYGFFFLGFAYVLAKHPFRIFVNSFWRYLGKISYSAYLTHLLALAIVEKVLPGYYGRTGQGVSYLFVDASLLFIVVFSITMVISTCTYYLIEKPGIIFGSRLIDKLEREGKLDLAGTFKRRNPFGKRKSLESEVW